MVTMTRGLTMGCVALLLMTGACTQVPLDYTHRSDASADAGPTADEDAGLDASADAPADASADAPPTEGGVAPESGPPPMAEAGGGDAGSGPACPCDSAVTGQYCCIPPGQQAPFCTSDGTSCAGASGIFVFCQSYDPGTASQCCWNGSPSAGGSALYAATCAPRPVACALPSDCIGQACNTRVCKGVTIGACGVTPVCP